MVYIIMGVSGCGKTTVGKILAKRLALKFYDADAYHSQANIDKMKRLVPLEDEDRMPWLLDLAMLVAHWNRGQGAVLACSALKEKYRQVLSRDGTEKVVFVYLEGDENLILGRMAKRKKHFFPSCLLKTQFNELEIPNDAITVHIDKNPGEICTEVIDKIRR